MRSNLSNADIALLSRELFDEICEMSSAGTEVHGIDYLEMHSLASIWRATERVGLHFLRRTDALFWIVHRLLRDGRIKLHKSGVLLQGTVEEQINVFRKAFPSSDEDADRKCTKPGHEPAYEGFGMNAWWCLDLCPAGVAWRTSAGTYQVAE